MPPAARTRRSWPTRPSTPRPITVPSARRWEARRPRAPRHLDKRTYQLNPANRREALTELRLDEAEGADIVMVKPAGLYLDIIRGAAVGDAQAGRGLPGFRANTPRSTRRPGWVGLTSRPAGRESLIAIKRAGADMILTYFAREMAAELAPLDPLERGAGHLDRVARLELRVLRRGSSGRA